MRLEGYDTIPVVLPTAPAGRGLTAEQRLRRTASRALAAGRPRRGRAAAVRRASEVLEALGGGMTPPRLVNPLSAEEALLRPTLLPGLLAAVARNVSRGLADVALFETGHVFLGAGGGGADARASTGRPTGRAAGRARRGAARAAAAPRRRARRRAAAGRWDAAVGAPSSSSAARSAWRSSPAPPRTGPWHPGRCAELLLDGRRVGLAGELHPRVVAALGLPARTCAAEANLDLLVAAAAGRGPLPAPGRSRTSRRRASTSRSSSPTTCPPPRSRQALRDGAGELLEDLRLFDVYTRPAGRRGQALAGVRPAVARPGPHPHRRRGPRRARRRRRRGRPPRRRRPARRLTTTTPLDRAPGGSR